MSRPPLTALTLLIASLLFVAPSSGQVPKEFPDAPAKQYIQQICFQCHAPQFLLQQRRTEDDWKKTVARMSRKGAGGPAENYDAIAAYMAKYFPATTTDGKTVNVNTATAEDLMAKIGLTKEEATAVVEYRTKNGNFRYWGDLLIIYGVDGRKLAAAKDTLIF